MSSRVDMLAGRLSRASVRRLTNPHARFDWPPGADSERLALSDQLLSLAHHPILSSLRDEQRWRVGLLELVQFFSLNIAGERELMMGLASRLYRRGDLIVSEYLQHFLHDENAHTVVFAGFCRRYAGHIYPDVTMRLSRKYMPGEEDFRFYAQALIFEEIATWFNIALAQDDDVWPLVRQINEYHASDEAMHIAFGRVVVDDLWSRYSQGWGEDGRSRIAHYLGGYIDMVLETYVRPDPYRDAGLDADAVQLRSEVLQSPGRRELHARATRSVRKFLTDRGILT